MPVRPRPSIAEYQLLTSRHMFPGKYILTNSMGFSQGIDAGVQQQQNLMGKGGVNMMVFGPETISIGLVLSMPIIVTTGPRPDISSRRWVDGLDFLTLILGRDFSKIDDATTKVFLYASDAYDSIAIKNVTISAPALQDVGVSIEILTNVEDPFYFVLLDGEVANLGLNNIFAEMRVANSSIDVGIGLQPSDNQTEFKIVREAEVSASFDIDEALIYGAGSNRAVFTYANNMIKGSFAVVDDLRSYQDLSTSYGLYQPSLQTYGALVTRSSNNSEAFTFRFSELNPTATFRFSSEAVYPAIRREVADGQLLSRVSVEAYGINS